MKGWLPGSQGELSSHVAGLLPCLTVAPGLSDVSSMFAATWKEVFGPDKEGNHKGNKEGLFFVARRIIIRD